jgi:virginiamycin B lyase
MSTRISSLLPALLAAGISLAAPTVLAAATITEYPLAPGAAPQGITLGPDGNVWFVENGANKVGRITAAGVITEFPLLTPDNQPAQIVAGTSGHLYLDEPGPTKVAFFDALGDKSFHESGSGVTAAGIAFGAAGSLWVTDGTSKVLAYSSEFSGVGQCTMSDGFAHGFWGITVGREGTLWMTDATSNGIVALTSSGCAFGKVSLPNSNSGPLFITSGQDGSIWFTEYTGNRIGRIQASSLNEFALPAGSHPMMIAPSLDGTLWFAEQGSNQIGHITHDGVIAHYTVPTAASAPHGVVVGPDGSVWFTEQNGSKIGRLQLHPSGDANGDGSVNVNDVFYLINFLFGGGPAPI